MTSRLKKGDRVVTPYGDIGVIVRLSHRSRSASVRNLGRNLGFITCYGLEQLKLIS